MKPFLPEDRTEEISTLIATLHETEKRLEKLTGGEVDAVADLQGRTFLLRHAQDHLRRAEAEKQASILNALPAQIALIDSEGAILAVNDSWRRFSASNALQGPGFEVGVNYIDLCAGATGDSSREAREAALGIQRVIQGEAAVFSIEYPCHSPTEERWYRLTATPVQENRPGGAVVMHINITERKLAEEKLQQSEERFRGTFEQAAVGIAHVSTEGQFLRVNDKLCDITGYSRDEMLRTTFASLTLPEDAAQSLKARRAMLDGGMSYYTTEKRYLRKNEEVIWVNLVTTLQRTAAGEPQYFISVFEDITGRKHMEDALEALSLSTERRERMLTTTLSSLSDFAYIFDKEVRFLFANQPLLDLWELTIEDVVGKNFAELAYPEDQAKQLQSEVQEVFATGKSITNETPYTSPKGRKGYYEYIFSPAFSTDGIVDFVVGSTRDITVRKQAELEVRFNEQRFRSLVEASASIVWDTPASGEFESEQPGWTAFTGQSFEELRGWGWLDAIHPDDQEETGRVWALAVADRSVYEVEHRLLSRDQTYHHMAVRAVPILSEDGTIFQWIGIHSDITESKKLQNQFLRVQRMESIGTLAGGVAHDLNNSLAPILMALEILRAKIIDDEGLELLDTLEGSAQHAAELVKQVLSFARGVEGRRIVVNTVHLLNEIQKIIRDTFPKNINFSLAPAHGLWTVTGDPTQLHQVFTNLCVNARDAMPLGGNLRVTMENAVLDDVFAETHLDSRPGNYVIVKVSDGGSGIPASIRDKIFEPFFTTKEIGKGTGLGLSTTMAIIKSHGGFINLYSEMGRGSVFEVYIPADPSVEAAENSIAKKVQPPRGNGEMILVVDDEKNIQIIAQKTLEQHGYRVMLASNGVEALAIYAQYSDEIAIVLTDMAMPVMDGTATIGALKAFNPKVKIIASSGFTSAGGAALAERTGIKYFVPKPYRAEVLLKTLSEALGEPG